MNLFSTIFSMKLYADGEEVVPETPVVDVSEGNNETNVSAIGIDNYMGSKEVNPDGRKLKDFDRTFYSSKEEIDQFIKDAGEKIFLPKELESKKTNEQNNNKTENKEAVKDKEKDKKAEKADEETDEEAAKKFLEEIEISNEEFLKLPEKVQERLASPEHSQDNTHKNKYEEINSKYSELVKDISELKKDPVIASRLEEKRTGKKYVATDLPAISSKEANELINLSGDNDEFITALNELIVKKAHDVLKIERGVVERLAEKEKNEKEAAKILQTIIDKEPRFGITEKDITKIDETHPEYEKMFGKGGIMEELKRKRYSPLQLIAKGTDELLREIASSKGWDKEDKNKIFKQGRNSILDTLRKAKSVAQTLEIGKQSLGKNVSSAQGFDKGTLISDIASGKTSMWSKLISDADSRGDIKMRTQLTEIYDEALRMGNKTI